MRYASGVPKPTASPMAETAQIEAAVVRPRVIKPSRTIAPAPRKPMPVITPAATRAPRKRPKTPITAREPIATKRCVRRPAGLCAACRCAPTAPPSAAAATRLRNSQRYVIAANSRREARRLRDQTAHRIVDVQAVHALERNPSHLVRFLARRERGAPLGGERETHVVVKVRGLVRSRRYLMDVDIVNGRASEFDVV